MPKVTSSDKKKLPAKYHDAPRFDMIYKYEGQAKKDYGLMLNRMVNEIGKKAISLTNDNQKS